MAYAPVYNAVTWTVAELIDEVTREARLPSSSDFTDAYILAEADKAIASLLSEPVVNNLGMSGRWLDYDDVLVSSAYRSGAEYLVPNASASGAISHIDYYPTGDAQPVPLRPINAAEVTDVLLGSGVDGAPNYWYFRDNRIVLYPVPTSVPATARVRIWFPRAHPKLVATTDNVGTVGTVTQSANTIEVAGPPSNWPGMAPFALDIYDAQAPHGPLITRLRISGISGTTFTYTAPAVGETDLDEALGMKAAASGTCDCVQLPGSMRKALAARTASFLLRQIGDEARANSLWGVSREEIASAADMMQPRAKSGSPIVINRRSVLRSRRNRWWF